MPTLWTTPNTISQFAEYDTHVPWENVNDFAYLKFPYEGSVKTTKSLLHVAVSRDNPVKMKTFFLRISGFQFADLPDVIQGLEVEIACDRGGRITDDTVQLYQNNDFIGENLADSDTHPIKIYGSQTDNWGVDINNYIKNSGIELVLRFQSHPLYPHNSTPLLDSVRARCW